MPVKRSSFSVVPDFQGGLVIAKRDTSDYQKIDSIVKLDGITGQASATYTPPSGATYSWNMAQPVVVHTDGTIFVFQHRDCDTECIQYVAGVDPDTGEEEFSVELGSIYAHPLASDMIIAGDGYAYVAYWEYGEAGQNCETYWKVPTTLTLVRISSSGTSTQMPVETWDSCYQEVGWVTAHLITNADTGVLVTWNGGALDSGQIFGMAVTNGTSVGTPVFGASAPGQVYEVIPVLQAEDGSFVGTVQTAPDEYSAPQTNMIAFDAAGTVRWIVPNEQPLIATADGGVIGQSGITYDANGNATGQGTLYTQSWTGNMYQIGSIDRFFVSPTLLATSFAAFQPARPTAALRRQIT